ncbi:MAG: alkaline phosphatase D family protein [Actinomycetota bacterium]|nr:alkaline phosphatase D family protein [Actinomycetota bacterium]
MLARRDVLRRLPGAAAAGLVMHATGSLTGDDAAGLPGDQRTFRHGVASGDPEAEGAVLWTRVSGADGPVSVRWVVASDPELDDVVASGRTEALPERDWTVHVDAGGLRPATTWWYGFEAGGARSPTGRTRTAPGRDDRPQVRLGVVSCSSFSAGRFTAYRRLAERDVELVVHLGDYIYEADDEGAVRRHEPTAEPVSLADYRARHAQYRTDPDLQGLHQRFPVAVIWDDHDLDSDAWRGGSPSHDPRRHGPWEERRAAALRAFLEWLPVRRPDPDEPERIWRSVPLGATAELLMLDTRHEGRDRQVDHHHPDPGAALSDPGRRIISEAQEAWLSERLRTSPAAWRLLANQVVLSPMQLEVPEALGAVGRRLGLAVGSTVMNADQWDGYPAARQRLLDVMAEDAVGPVGVLTGDIHSSWAFDVPAGARPGEPPVAVEVVVPSVTSPSFAQLVGIETDVASAGASAMVAAQLPHVRWNDLRHHGYLIVDVGPERLQADWWHVDAIDGSCEGERLAASWMAEAGDVRLRPAPAPLAERPATTPPPGTAEPSEPPAVQPREAQGDDGPRWVQGVVTLAAAVVAGLIAVRRRRHR